MQNESAYVRELYAVTEAVKKWRHYLLGQKFRVYTDQRSLKHFLSQTIQTPEQHKWATKLLGYEFEVHYKPGKDNKVADALSRIEDACLLALSVPTFTWLQELRDYFLTHPEGKALLERVLSPMDTPPNYSLHDGLLYVKNRLLIPVIPSLRQRLLHEFHSSPVGGHSGVHATVRRIKASFSWSKLKEEVTRFIAECKVCQQTKYSTQKPYGLLQPLPVPKDAWSDISMDFVTQLPPSDGKTTIWVIVDRLTKFAHFISLPAKYTATSLATIFLQQVYRLHGLPGSIVSDRDPLFLSRFWKDLFVSMGTKLLHSSAYHPQTDGQTEVLNRCLESYLRAFVHDEPRKWNRYVHLAEFWYNTTYHSAIEMSPFQALYGRVPPTLPHYTIGQARNVSVEEILLQHDKLMEKLKETLRKTRQRMAEQANKHRQEKEFEVGEWVLLKLQAHRQMSVKYRQNHKLSARYFGPFKIVERIGNVAYKLDLPIGARIHPVFHVSLLRAFKGNWDSTSGGLPSDLIEFIDENVNADLEDKVSFEGRDGDMGLASGSDLGRPNRVRKTPARYLE